MQRRPSSSTSRRVRSADSQLDEMIHGMRSSGSRALGAVGDLFRGMVPSATGGSSVSGSQGDLLGVRSVRVVQRESRSSRAREPESAGRDGGFLASAPGESMDGRGGEVVTGGTSGGEVAAARAAGADGAAAAEAAGVANMRNESRLGVSGGGLFGDLVTEGSGQLGVSAGEVRSEVASGREVPVNPFWSPERKAFERLHYGENILGELGTGMAMSETPPGQVEMNPIQLFRIRCLREAEEKFREGLLKMTQEGSSSSSFHSANEGRVGGDQPKPPPGPPPESPPRVPSVGIGSVPPPPPPPLPPIPPMPQFGPDSGGKGRDDLSSMSLVGENPSESLRTFDLPKLDEETTALEFGDWLSMVDSHMGDLSYSSNLWWKMIRRAVDGCYQEWLSLGPLERLRLKPMLDSQVHLWPRTERRALSMLLQAIPESVRSEVISARKLTTDQVLFRLFCTYQPGGSMERTKLLQAISDCKCGETVKEVLTWVRTWRRYVGRAKELGVTLPDALVLVGVLQFGSEFLSQRSPQVAYRLNMIRQQLYLDQQPTTSNVLTYSEHLQAEAEEMALAGGGLGEFAKPPKPATKPVMKVLSENSGTDPPRNAVDLGKGSSRVESSGQTGGLGSSSNLSLGICKFWGSDEGCKRGDRCKFSHSTLSPKDNRCFGCSALGHSKKDCPFVKKKIAKAKSSSNLRKEGEDQEKGGKGTDGKGTPRRPPGIPPEVGTGSEAHSGEENVDKML